MRISQLPALAICLGIGGLAVAGSLPDAAYAAALAPASSVSSQCQSVPAPSPSPSPSDSSSSSPTPSVSPTPTPTDSPTTSASPTGSASPTDPASVSPTATQTATTAALFVKDDTGPADLCISVQASADTFQAGQKATWTVQVWAPDGAVTGITVYLSGTMAGQPPVFSNTCPGGNGGTSCYVGDLATSTTPSSDTMQAQIAVPSGTTSGTSVTLTATANATPSLPTMPAAATAVTTTTAASSSPSASASASAASSGSSSSRSASSSSSTTVPGVSGQSTVTPAPGTVGTVTLPGIGTIPALATSATSATGVSGVTNPGSISSLLPVISPGPSATSPTSGLQTSPAADNAAGGDRSSADSGVLVISTAAVERVGIVVLLVLIVVALRMRTKTKVLVDRAARGASSEPAATRRIKPSGLLRPRRKQGDAPK